MLSVHSLSTPVGTELRFGECPTHVIDELGGSIEDAERVKDIWSR